MRLLMIRSGLEGERLGIERSPVEAVPALITAGFDVVDASPVIDRAKSIKTPTELELIRASVEGTEAAVAFYDHDRASLQARKMWDLHVLSQTDVTDALLRTGDGPGDLELEALYTPRWYFAWSGRPEPDTGGEPTFAFFVFETTHKDDLPTASPIVTIESQSGSVDASEVLVVTDSPHHRVLQVFFRAVDASGDPTVSDDEALVLEATWAEGTGTNLEWESPMPFGLAALNAETDTSTGFTFRSPALSLGEIARL